MHGIFVLPFLILTLLLVPQLFSHTFEHPHLRTASHLFTSPGRANSAEAGEMLE